MTLQAIDTARKGLWELAVRNYMYQDTTINQEIKLLYSHQNL